MSQLDTLLRISKDQHQFFSHLGSGEESAFKLIQVIGRILFLAAVEMRCLLSSLRALPAPYSALAVDSLVFLSLEISLTTSYTAFLCL